MKNIDASRNSLIANSRAAELPENPVVYLQKFSVAYEFPVYFTENLFAPENLTLIETLSRREAGKQHRCMIFVDDGLIAAYPTLVDDIKTYANRHVDVMSLVAPPFAPCARRTHSRMIRLTIASVAKPPSAKCFVNVSSAHERSSTPVDTAGIPSHWLRLRAWVPFPHPGGPKSRQITGKT